MNEELKIKRATNDYYHGYDYNISDGNNILTIFFGGTLDLYMVIRTKDYIPYGKNHNIDFNISKDNYELYSIFDKLYNEIINAKLYDDESLNKGLNKREPYKSLVNKDKSITWRSDDEPFKQADRVTITKEEDNYKLSFSRVSYDLDSQYSRNGFSIPVRFRNSGSRYDPFNIAFMKMFNRLQNINPEYHQVDAEEVVYNQKVLSKKK